MKKIMNYASQYIKENYKKGLIYSSLWLFLSCLGQKKEIAIELIKDNGYEISDNYNGYILLIPNIAGCSQCSEYSLNFSKKNLQKKNIYFVVTSDFDFKKTKFYFNEKELMSKNLVFDKKMKSKINNLQSSTLLLIVVKDGLEVNKEELNPENVVDRLTEIQNNLR